MENPWKAGIRRRCAFPGQVFDGKEKWMVERGRLGEPGKFKDCGNVSGWEGLGKEKGGEVREKCLVISDQNRAERVGQVLFAPCP